MKLLTGNPYYYVHWCETKEFSNERPFPLVYLNNGELCYSLLSFLKFLYSVGSGKNTSSLNDLFRCIAELTVLFEVSKHEHNRWRKDPRLLIIDYFEKSLHGTVRNGHCELGLWWTGRTVENVKRMLSAFSKYEIYCATYLNADPLSTSEVLCQSTIAYSEFRRRTEFNLLSHLRGKPSNHSENSFNLALAHGQEQVSQRRNNFPKYFPPEQLMELVESTLDPNQKAIYLLCAFAGLRASEVLHVFVNDIVVQDGCLIPDLIVDHPVSGKTWCPKSGQLVSRIEVLNSFKNTQYYDPELSEKELKFVRNPIPRVNVPKPLHSGWKGGLLEPTVTKYNYVVQWTEENAQLKFFDIVNKFLMRQKRCNHPYLFCSTNGAPLRLSTYSKRFERESERLTGERYAPHSLRHFCGFYASNCLEVPIDVAKIILRHKRITSTAVYYHMSSEKLSDEIKKAKGIEIRKINRWKSISFSKELLRLK